MYSLMLLFFFLSSVTVEGGTADLLVVFIFLSRERIPLLLLLQGLWPRLLFACDGSRDSFSDDEVLSELASESV